MMYTFFFFSFVVVVRYNDAMVCDDARIPVSGMRFYGVVVGGEVGPNGGYPGKLTSTGPSLLSVGWK